MTAQSLTASIALIALVPLAGAWQLTGAGGGGATLPGVQARTAGPDELGTGFVSTQLTIGLAPLSDLEELLEGTGAELAAAIDSMGIHLVELPAGTSFEDAELLAAELDADPGSVWVEVNRWVAPPETGGCGGGSGLGTGAVGSQDCTVSFFDGTPTSGEYYDQPTVPLIGAVEAQALLSGTPTVVAVIDTGIDPTHPLFADNLFSPGLDVIAGSGPALDWGDGLDNDGDGLVDEAFGHGTHVAGTIVLVHPDALILPYRVLDSDGNGTAYHVAAAIVDAVLSGADVINLSLGMSGPSAAVEAAIGFANEAGAVVVASAGNTGGTVLYPGAYDGVHAIAALDASDLKASFSAYGSDVALSAPGVDIYSALPGGAYGWWSGTSMATAVASGAVSLTRALTEDLTSTGEASAEALEAVEEGAVEVDALNPSFGELLGSGRIDVQAAAEQIESDD